MNRRLVAILSAIIFSALFLSACGVPKTSTAFFEAVENNEVENVHKASQAHPEWIKEKDEYGYTSLHLAAYKM